MTAISFQKEEAHARIIFRPMPISQYLKNLREKIGTGILQIPSVAAIIRDESGSILLVRNADGNVWGLPAGAIDLGEGPEEAVVREVFEETGLTVLPESIVGVFGGENFRYVYPNGDRVEYFVVVYKCKILDGELSAIDGEIADFQFFKVEEMLGLALPYPKSIF